MAFERCRLGWFEACSRKPTSKGLPSSSIQLRKPDGLAFVTHDPLIFYFDIPRLREMSKNRLPDGDGRILLGTMIGGGFLTAEERQDLTELARDGLAEHRLARRANALVLLDRGMSCVGRVLLIDDDTIRTWHRLFEADGVDGLAGFKYGGRACQLTLEQQVTLKAWVGDTLPRTTRSVDRAGVRDRLREPLRADR